MPRRAYRQEISMKVKSGKELEKEARRIFVYLEKGYKPCEALYVVSELTKIMSLAMLQRENEVE